MAGGSGIWSGRMTRAFCNCHAPAPRVASPASIRAEQPVAAVQTEHADLRRGQPLAVQLHAERMDDGDALRRQARDRTAAARAGRRSAPAGRPRLEIGIVHRLGASEHHRRQRADRGRGEHAEQPARRAWERRGTPRPTRPAARATIKLRRTRQAPEAQHAAEQHRERQDLHGDIGQPQRGDLSDQGEGRVRLRDRAAQQFDEVEQRDQTRTARAACRPPRRRTVWRCRSTR